MAVQKGDTNPQTGKAYAVNPSTGAWDDNYWANVVEPQMIAKDPVAQAQKIQQQQMQLQQEAIKPAIQSLEAGIPETQQKFATERTQLEQSKTPLKQRYSSLLDELKRREGVETKQVGINTAQEYGKRGIPLSSGVYANDLQNKTGDISQYYGGQYKDVSLSQEENLSGIDKLIATLTGQETESVRAIRNAMAQLQAGGAQSGIQNALSLLQQQQQQQQFESQQGLSQQELALKQRELELAQQPKAPEQYATLGEGSTLFNLLTGQPMYTAPKTYKETAGSLGSQEQQAKSQALQKIQQGYRYNSLLNEFGSNIDPKWLEYAYNQGPVAKEYGPAKITSSKSSGITFDDL